MEKPMWLCGEALDFFFLANPTNRNCPKANLSEIPIRFAYWQNIFDFTIYKRFSRKGHNFADYKKDERSPSK